jgi:hypothetical protein
MLDYTMFPYEQVFISKALLYGERNSAPKPNVFSSGIHAPKGIFGERKGESDIVFTK